MAEEKQGLLRRIFSFGRKAQEPQPPADREPLAAPEKAAATGAQASEAPAPEPVEAVAAAVRAPAAETPEPDDVRPAPPARTKAPRPAAAEKPPAPPEAEPVREVQPVAEARNGKVRLFPDRQKPAAPAVEAPAATGWLGRLREGLSRSSGALTGGIASVFVKRRLDDATLQELEDLLIQADLGVETSGRIAAALSASRLGRDVTPEEVREVMAGEIEKVLAPVARPLELDLAHRPHVILVVGVNGSGKTTTIGKLAAKLKEAGLSTLLVAGDTFRAAAIEQLKIWGERAGSPVVARELGADAAGLAFDAWGQASENGHDVMLMDTAGRLQNKMELMAELEKIVRVLRKRDATAPHTVLLTLDATTGQNALNQVEIFGRVAGVNGLVMTKLDGTARGGILVAIASKYGLPVYFLGVGEGVDDLEPFEAADFARSIAGLAASGAKEAGA